MWTRGLTARKAAVSALDGPEQGVDGRAERGLLQVRAAKQTSSRMV